MLLLYVLNTDQWDYLFDRSIKCTAKNKSMPIGYFQITGNRKEWEKLTASTRQ